MYIVKGKQIKRILMVFFLLCVFVLCSCHKEIKNPQETYNITYVINEHGEQPKNLTNQTHLPDPLPVLSEDGWTFEGWYTTNTFASESEAIAGSELREDTTLYAKWTEIVKKYSITFETSGHGEQPENLAEQTHLPDPLPVLSEEGFKFGGWYTTNTFDSGSEAIAGTELKEDTTLYAKWTEIVKKYSITFETEGYGEQPQNLTNQTHLPDPLPELSAEWRIFEGWFFDRQFKDQATAGEVLTENTTLYAKWEIIYTVEINYKVANSNAGTIIGETHQVIEQGTDGTPVTVVPNDGYRFIGWYKSEGNWEVERTDEITRVDKNVQKYITAVAAFEGPITCLMDFRTTEGGRIDGLLKQSVLYGGKGFPVTAIPDDDYRFIKWSDGETNPTRSNDCVTNMWDSVITAEFERYKRPFKLEYNEATSNTDLTEYTFYLDNMEKEQYLPVPQREGYEFMGWYSDWFHTVQVTDKTGKMIVDRDWFKNDCIFDSRTNPDMKLFAKWKPIKEVPVYKILMIYVTEVHAALEKSDGEIVQADYVMSDFDKKRFEVLVTRLEEYLEAILNGTVDFQIDTYYTKVPLNEDNFYRGSSTSLTGGNKLYDEFGIAVEDGDLPEVNNMLGNYGSVLTSFSMNDYVNKLHVTAGSGSKKYGNIHLEFVGKETEHAFNLYYPGIYIGWVERIGLYIHELTHTLEFQLQDKDYYGIHEAEQYYGWKVGQLKTEFDVLNDYLRNEFIVDGRNVGIPYEFWTGEYEKK